MICYAVGSSGQQIVFTDKVLSHFERYRQHRFWHKEAGGLLFATLNDAAITITVATGPRPTDRRGRCSYHPDRRAEQQEIDKYHAEGFHFVGEWHTHPEPIPKPSPLDERTMIEAVCKSRHDLYGFVLAIVGQTEFPVGLNVSIFTQTTSFVLDPMKSPAGAVELEYSMHSTPGRG